MVKNKKSDKCDIVVQVATKNIGDNNICNYS